MIVSGVSIYIYAGQKFCKNFLRHVSQVVVQRTVGIHV